MFLVKERQQVALANYLKSNHIKTPTGKGKLNWTKNNCEFNFDLMKNIKVMPLLQKTYTENYLDHKIVKNNGQIPQYYVEKTIIQPSLIERCGNKCKLNLEREQIGAQYSSSIYSHLN